VKLGSSEAKLLLSKAVYMFSIGSNDYLSPFLTDSDVLNSFSHSEYVAMVVRNITSIIKVQIYSFFLFIFSTQKAREKGYIESQKVFFVNHLHRLRYDHKNELIKIHCFHFLTSFIIYFSLLISLTFITYLTTTTKL